MADEPNPEYIERAKQADIALDEIQKKFQVKLKPTGKLHYHPSGIHIETGAVWEDLKKSDKIEVLPAA